MLPKISALDYSAPPGDRQLNRETLSRVLATNNASRVPRRNSLVAAPVAASFFSLAADAAWRLKGKSNAHWITSPRCRRDASAGRLSCRDERRRKVPRRGHSFMQSGTVGGESYEETRFRSSGLGRRGSGRLAGNVRAGLFRLLPVSLLRFEYFTRRLFPRIYTCFDRPPLTCTV